MNAADLITELVDGWHERVEYAVYTVAWHTEACTEGREGVSRARARHWTCLCPRRREQRAETRLQPSLMSQLREASYATPVNGDTSGGSGSVNKPEAKIPGNLAGPDEILCKIACAAAAAADVWAPPEQALRGLRQAFDAQPDPDLERALADDLRPLVRQARMMLGYDSDTVTLAETVCGSCGGALTVPRTLTPASSVRCAGTPATAPCGTTYPSTSWHEMLRTLVSTEAACEMAGVPRGTLYRWASQGRITRYGAAGKGQARWDAEEIAQNARNVANPLTP